jgi:hypothetical protein
MNVQIYKILRVKASALCKKREYYGHASGIPDEVSFYNNERISAFPYQSSFNFKLTKTRLAS